MAKKTKSDETAPARRLRDLHPWQDYYAKTSRRTKAPAGEVIRKVPNRYYTIGQAAALLGVSVSYLRKLEKEGVVSYARLGKSHRRISEENLVTIQNYLGMPTYKRANKAVAYIRTFLTPRSAGAQDDVNEQRAKILQYLEDPARATIQLDDEDIFVDYAGSSDLSMRPGLRQLLDRCLHQDITHVLVVSADRLSMTDGGTLVAILHALGKTVTEVDPSYPVLTTEVISDFENYLYWFLSHQLHLDLESPGPDQSFYEQLRILVSRFIMSRFKRVVE